MTISKSRKTTTLLTTLTPGTEITVSDPAGAWKAGVPFERIERICWDYVNGGSAMDSRVAIHAHIFCTDLAEGHPGRRCERQDHPHRLRVIVLKEDNGPCYQTLATMAG